MRRRMRVVAQNTAMTRGSCSGGTLHVDHQFHLGVVAPPVTFS
jgi:hypothetical protein